MDEHAAQNPKQNRILAGLLDEDSFRLIADLESVPLQLGQVLFKPGDHVDHVYFPTSGIVSMVFTTEDGESAELAMIGNDGLIGTSSILCGATSTYRAVVQSKGSAYRIRADIVKWEFEHGGDFRHLALGHVQALLTQVAQSVVCNRHHTIDQQLCRWLLMSLDLLPGNHVDMTQELIANMLGVRREGVTEAAGRLKTAGLIDYHRGHITVVDRAKLEKRVCECYRVVRAEYDRLFWAPPSSRTDGRTHLNPVALRRRAEKRLQEEAPPLATSTDTAHLLRELQAHQIELEMQNEELRRAHEESDALRARYADLFDFAPAPYLCVDAQGTILEANLAAAIRLGVKRSQMDRQRLGTSLTESSSQSFNRFLDQVLNEGKKGFSEVVLKPTPLHRETRVRLEGVPDEEGRECRIVMTILQPELLDDADRRSLN